MISKEGAVSLSNYKRFTCYALIFLLLVLGAVLVSSAPAVVTINNPTAAGFFSGSLAINVSVTGASGNVTNITVNVYDSSDTLVFSNFTNNTDANFGNISEFQVTWPADDGTFADGIYLINVSIVENVTSTPAANISSNNLTITVDNTNPNSTITIADDDGNDLTTSAEVKYATVVTVTCNSGDVTAGTVTTNNTISVLFPGLTSYQNLSLFDNTAVQILAEISDEETENVADYSIKCFTMDKAGNSNTSVFNFSVVPVVTKGSNAVAIPGFQLPVGTQKTSSGVVNDAGRLTTEGSSRLIAIGGAVKFDVKGEPHKVEVESASETSVSLIISSTPIDVTIPVGESKSIDLNNDGVDDMEITYHQYFSKKYADLTFKLTSEPTEKAPVVDSNEDVTPPTQEPIEEYTSPISGLTVTLAVIIIILIIGYALIKGKKK